MTAEEMEWAGNSGHWMTQLDEKNELTSMSLDAPVTRPSGGRGSCDPGSMGLVLSKSQMFAKDPIVCTKLANHMANFTGYFD